MRFRRRLSELFVKPQLVAGLAVALILCATLGSTLIGQRAEAATASTINFQARLMNNAGSIAADGNYNIEFKLYDTASTGGTAQGVCTGSCKWVETRTGGNVVTVANGYVTVSLGSVTAFGTNINWDQDLWLTMNIGGTGGSPSWDGEMTPRLKLTAVPYAFRAGQLASLAGSNTGTLKFASSFGQDSVITLPDPGASTATVCYQNSASCGFVTGSSSSFIQNGTSVQTGANFNIRSNAAGSVTGVLQGANGQTADLFDVQTWNGSVATTVFGVNNVGDLTVQNVNVAANKGISLASGTGTYTQSYSNNSGTAATFGITDNASSGATTVQGVAINLTGTNNASGSNNLSGLVFGNVAAATNNAFHGIDFGTGFTDLLRYNGTALISGSGIVQSAAISGSYTGITGVGNLTSGSLGSGFTTVAVGQGGTGATSFTSNGVLYGNNTGAIQSTAAGTTGQCLVGNTGNAPSWSSCVSSVSLQSAYTGGNTISTSSNNIGFTLNGSDSFTVATAAGATGSTTFSLTDGSNATPPSQLVLIQNNDINQPLATGLKVSSAAGGITTAIDVSGTNITTALAIGANAITGTYFGVSNTGAVTAVGVNSGTGLLQGTGGMTVTGTAQINATTASATTIGSTSGGSVSIQAGSSGISIGSGGAANTIQLGNTSGGVTQTINIGNNSTASSTNNVNIGSSIAGTTAITGATTITNRTSGSSDTLAVSNSTSTGNIAVFKDNTTAVLTIADGGATTFQNQTNTASAFRVLNSTGGELVGVDSLGSNLTLAGLNTAAIVSGGWTNNTNALPSLYNTSATTANGYVYVVGGFGSGDVAVNTVYYAKLNANGSIGSWATTTNLPANRAQLTTVAANGYLYAIGGKTETLSAQSTVYYARLNANGTVGAWNTATSLSSVNGRASHTSVVANGYVYVLGGEDNSGSSMTTVLYARLNADGTLGSWTSTNGFDTIGANQARRWHSSVAANGYVYSVGGAVNGTDSTQVAYAKLNSNGTVGSWATTTALPSTRSRGAAVVLNGYLYHLGGHNSTYWDVYAAPLNADGTISAGTWTTQTHMNTERRGLGAVTANGYVYAIAGENGGAVTNQEYASPSRVRLGTSLDLIGINGENLADGSAGGQLTAGNTQIVGTLQVQDAAQFAGNVSVNGVLAVHADTNSTAAFAIQNAGTTNTVFVADTTNGRIGINIAPGSAPSADLSFGVGDRTINILDQTTSNTNGNTLTINSGKGNGSGNGGTLTLQAATGGATGNGGVVNVTGGTAGGATKLGGNINITGGTGNTSGTGGAVTLQGGTGGNAATGGLVTIQGGNAGGGNTNGANVVITGGTGTGTGVLGLVSLAPTAFVSSGATQTFNGGSGCPSCSVAGVDTYSTIAINATVTGLSINIPVPNASNQVTGRILYVTAVSGSQDFTIVLGGTSITIAMKANSTATLIWNGTGWTAAGASSSTDLQAAYNNTASTAGAAELVLKNTATSNGLTVRNGTGTDEITGALLEVQTSIGSNLLSINNNATEYATNGGAETAGASSSAFPSNTWDATTGGTVDRWTTAGDNVATGQASVRVQTTTTNHGARNRLSTSLTSGLTYTVSFAARGAVNFNTLQVLYSPDGTTTGTTQCATAKTATSGIWSRITCSFVASGTITSSNSILIRQTDATARTFYIDNLSVNVNASATFAADGSADNAGAFATNWTNYAASGTSTVGQETSVIYNTSASARAVLSATAGIGIRNNLAITPQTNTQYLVTFYMRSTTAMSGTVGVGFLPAGGTGAPSGTAACTDYNTQTLAANTWVQISCLFTTAGTTITDPDLVIYQTDAAARTIYIDALSVTLNTNTSNNVQVGSANKGGPVTLFTLDRSNGAPIAANNDAYLGSMYYDTSTGRIQCYESTGWGACGAPPDNIVNLNPEYAGAVLNGTGVGTMTADFCSNDAALTVNSTLCSTGQAKNFYKWTSPQPTAQTYSIYVTYQLPATFNGFANDDTVQLVGRVDSTSNASVTYEMYKSTGSTVTQCGSGSTNVITGGGGSANTWYSYGVNGNESTGCGFNSGSASNFIIFKINLTAQSNASAYVSTLSFTTTGR